MLVSKEFEKLTNGKCKTEEHIIKRIKNTKPQYKLTKKEREENLKDAFELVAGFEMFKDKNILILDDIFTTGVTLREMVKLFKAMALKILCALQQAAASMLYNKRHE